MKTPIKGTTMSTDWKVGIIPAIICGVGVYIMARVYFDAGSYEILDDLVANEKRYGKSHNN